MQANTRLGSCRCRAEAKVIYKVRYCSGLGMVVSAVELTDLMIGVWLRVNRVAAVGRKVFICPRAGDAVTAVSKAFEV
ncbi:hypothetical protein EGK63_01660 [Brevundimonas sp. 357]|nr:hypothetical protein EGK63_01660 [Brevundimonas sp. 357]